MKKVAIRNKINTIEKESKAILEKMFLESIMEMNYKDFICKDMLDRIVLIYLSLFGEKDYIEIEDLSKYELNIIRKIITRGICYIYINEKYLTQTIRYKKMLIIDELIDFIHLITDTEKNIIKILVIRDMEKYIEDGFFLELA